MNFVKAVFLLGALMGSAVHAETLVDGLVTVTPEWHEAIANGDCLNNDGFGPCATSEVFEAAENGQHYQGTTLEASRLLTQFNIYSEECRGAVGVANIDGWCAKRDSAREDLAAQGICMGDSGFQLCAVVAQGDLPIFGEWDCDGGTVTIDATTYQGKPISVIEKLGDDYLVTLADGYRFATFEVTPTSFTWYSPQTSDSFECRKP